MLKCGVAEDGMSTILFSTMPNFEFSIVCDHEIAHVSPCRSTALSLCSSDDERAPLFLENLEGRFTHE